MLPLREGSCTGRDNQEWRLSPTADGYYNLIVQSSGKCMQRAFGSIVQNSCGSSPDGQKFRFTAVTGGYYNLIAKYNGYCVTIAQDASGTLQTFEKPCDGQDSQKLRMTTDAPLPAEVKLLAKHSNKCAEVSGVSGADGARLQQWGCHVGDNQRFQLTGTTDAAGQADGYYKLVARHSGKCVDVSGHATGDGAAIQQWSCNGGDNQRFRLAATPDGHHNLVAKHSGKCLNLANMSAANGAVLDQWGCSNIDSQKFKLVDAAPLTTIVTITAKHSGKALDVSGVSHADGARIQQWTYAGQDNQRWRLANTGDGYYNLVAVHSGKCIDVYNFGTADGALVNQWTCNGQDAQKLRLEATGDGHYRLVVKHSGKCLNLANMSAANGAFVDQWSCSTIDSQRFKLLAEDLTSGSAVKKIGRGWCTGGANRQTVLENDHMALKFYASHLELQVEGVSASKFFPDPAHWGDGNLCFQGDGNLVVYNSSGTAVWASGTDGTSANTLVLDGCTLKISDGWNTYWSYTAPGCQDAAVKSNGGWCRDLSQAGTLAARDAVHLDWRDSGELVLQHTDGSVLFTSGTAGTGRNLCFQADGNLAIYGANGPVWSAGTAGKAVDTLTVDSCGVALVERTTSDWYGIEYEGTTEHWRRGDGRCDASAIRRPSTFSRMCRTAGASGTMLRTGDVSLAWTGGNLVFSDASGVQRWTSGATGGQMMCQDFGKWVIYSSSGAEVWKLGQSPDVLSLEGCTVALSRFSGTTTWSQGGYFCGPGVNGSAFSFVYDKWFGNSTFGAGLWIVAGGADASTLADLRAKANASPRLKSAMGSLMTATVQPSFAKVLGNAGIDATVFEKRVTIIEADGYVTNENNGAQQNRATLEVLGFTLFNQSIGASYSKSVEKEFFSKSTTFSLLGVPITVEGSLTGEVGISGDAELGSTGLGFHLTPFAGLSATGSAAVGCDYVSAGVEGTVTIIDVSVPFGLDLSFGSADFGAYSASASLELSTLDGELELFAKAIGQKASKTIFSWDGRHTSVPLFSKSGYL